MMALMGTVSNFAYPNIAHPNSNPSPNIAHPDFAQT